jgi:hypothetical protein
MHKTHIRVEKLADPNRHIFAINGGTPELQEQ